MKLVAGLGNPGRRYANSRHNAGFMVVDALARRWSLDVSRHDKRFEASLGDGPVAAARALLLKPLTYMNLSGRSVGAAQRYYKLGLDDVLIVYDELDLPPGRLRVRATGTAGGHKGMQDVIRHLGDERIARIRVGIGKTDRRATTEHVLGDFAPAEREVMTLAIETAADAVEHWLRHGIEKTMNEFNKRDAGPARVSGSGNDTAS